MTQHREKGAASAVSLDIAGNRRARKWTGREMAGRALWEILRGPLFAWTPRPLWGWRRMVLRAFGARVGREVHVFPSVRIAVPWNLTFGDEAAVGDRAILYSLGRIEIGAQTTISQGAHLCAGTHDYLQASMPLVKASISIGAGAWICADAFIGPGVSVGARAIVGARAVAVKNVEPGKVVAGNPARVVRDRPPVQR